MANTINTSTLIVKEAMRGLMTQCQVIKALNTSYSKRFNSNGGDLKKGGATIYVPKPCLGTVGTTWNINVADETQLTVPITIDTVRNVAFDYTEAERALSFDEAAEYSRDYIMPKVSQLSATIDAYCASVMKNYIFNVSPVTTLGTSATTINPFMTASRMIKEQLVPMDGPLSCIIGPQTEESLVPGLSGQYNPSRAISDIWEKGQITKAAGMDWYMSQNMPSHTHGTCTTGSTPTVSGYGVNTLTISGMTSGGTLTAGDSFYLSACYPVNFETKTAYTGGQRFVVTSTTTGSGTNITVSVKPDIYITGPNQTVSGTPVGSTVTLHQTTASQVVRNDFVLHRDSFALSFAELYQPKGVEVAKTFTKNGVSVAYVKAFDINTRQQVSRLDVFFGISPMRPEWAARVIT